MHNKILYILIGTSLCVFVVLVVLGVFFSKKPVDQSQVPLIPTPTSFRSSGTSIDYSKPSITYQEDAGTKMLEKMEDNLELTPSDVSIRRQLVNQALSQQKTLYKTSSFEITYLSTFNLFLVEIMTSTISQTKQEAVAYFLSQGISQEGICNLPIMFFLNAQIANSMRGTDTQFSYLPEGC